MTQLDVPQISFARYLELLRRRRWQVIPVTVLGLLIGTGVAFLIPRYFVAYTQFSFQGASLEVPIGGVQQNDPMRPVVDHAKTLIPSTDTVAMVLAELAWPEALDEDSNARRAFLEVTKGRIEVIETEGYRGQEIVTLLISYRDTDGERSAEFANQLRDTFISSQRQRLEERAEGKLDSIQAEVEAATLAQSNAAKELQTHRRNHRIDLEEDRFGEVLLERGLNQQLGEAVRELGNRRRALADTTASLKLSEDRKIDGKVPPRIRVISAGSIPAELADAQLLARKKLVVLKARLANLKPAHPDYDLFVREVKQAEAALALDPTLGVPQARTERNPQFTALLLSIDKLRVLKITQSQAVSDQQVVVDELTEKLADLPKVWGQYEKFKQSWGEARIAKAVEVERETAALEQLRSLRVQDSFFILSRAAVPPVPTEPSILVVSVLGAVIGLVVAIALILLVDILQTTFKTLEDVERGLSIPVLGGMAHLQTDAERVRVIASRRRLAVVASTFLFLTFVVVTIYYVAPSRLPLVVYDLFDILLGSG